MAAEAASAAIADAGLTPTDGFTCFTTGDNAGPMQVAHAIGVDRLGWSVPISGGGNVVATTMANAMAAVVTGQAEVVVVYRVLGSNTRYGKASGVVHAAGD